MKIVQIIPSLERGGAERLCIDISNELLKRGNEVLLITFYDINEYEELTSNIPIKTVKASVELSFRGKNHINIQELQNSIDDFKPDVIHTHLYEAEIIVYELKTSAKLISHIHSNRKELAKKNLFQLTNKKKITQWFERKHYLKKFKALKVELISISKDCHDYAIRELGLSESQVHQVVNCINYELFKGNSKTLNDSKIKLINVGRFVPKKSQELLIDVAVILKEKGIDFDLTFLGDGAEKVKVIKYAKSKGVDHLVHFKGVVSKPEIFLKESTLYIHSAKLEPLGLVLIEAMASGLPVVTTDGFGNRDLIEEGKNGYMIWNRDPKIFAQKIEKIVTSPEQYNRISEYAIQYAAQYDIKPYIDRILSIYN